MRYYSIIFFASLLVSLVSCKGQHFILRTSQLETRQCLVRSNKTATRVPVESTCLPITHPKPEIRLQRKFFVHKNHKFTRYLAGLIESGTKHGIPYLNDFYFKNYNGISFGLSRSVPFYRTPTDTASNLKTPVKGKRPIKVFTIIWLCVDFLIGLVIFISTTNPDSFVSILPVILSGMFLLLILCDLILIYITQHKKKLKSEEEPVNLTLSQMLIGIGCIVILLTLLSYFLFAFISFISSFSLTGEFIWIFATAFFMILGGISTLIGIIKLAADLLKRM